MACAIHILRLLKRKRRSSPTPAKSTKHPRCAHRRSDTHDTRRYYADLHQRSQINPTPAALTSWPLAPAGAAQGCGEYSNQLGTASDKAGYPNADEQHHQKLRLYERAAGQ